jgi:hypothetical protein
MIVYYDSDEKLTVANRIWTSFKLNLIPLFLMLLFTVPSYFLLSNYTIPGKVATLYGLTPLELAENQSGCATPCMVYKGKMGFGWHVYAVTVWIGDLIFAIFGAVGLITLP